LLKNVAHFLAQIKQKTACTMALRNMESDMHEFYSALAIIENQTPRTRLSLSARAIAMALGRRCADLFMRGLLTKNSTDPCPVKSLQHDIMCSGTIM